MLRNLLNLPSWLQNAWAPTEMDHQDTVILFVVEGTEGGEAREHPRELTAAASRSPR